MKPGTRVRYGFRTGQVIRLESRGGIPRALVLPDAITVGDGYAPTWVPVGDLSRLEGGQ